MLEAETCFDDDHKNSDTESEEGDCDLVIEEDNKGIFNTETDFVTPKTGAHVHNLHTHKPHVYLSLFPPSLSLSLSFSFSLSLSLSLSVSLSPCTLLHSYAQSCTRLHMNSGALLMNVFSRAFFLMSKRSSPLQTLLLSPIPPQVYIKR